MYIADLFWCVYSNWMRSFSTWTRGKLLSTNDLGLLTVKRKNDTEWWNWNWNKNFRYSTYLCTSRYTQWTIPSITYFSTPVTSFKELLPYILSRQVVTSFLSEKLSQDPLEKFFWENRWRNQTKSGKTKLKKPGVPTLNFCMFYNVYTVYLLFIAS